jgi:alpha,alpha-trehalose phosphorylase
MDLGDVAGNASDGVHIASAAGVWSALVFGFGGVRDYDGQLSFSPTMPRSWTRLAFSLLFRGRQIRVQLSHDDEQYLLDEGDHHPGEPHLLTPRTAIAVKVPPP